MATKIKENYINNKSAIANSRRIVNPKTGKLNIDRPTAYRFCDDGVPLEYNNPNYISPNQRLVGAPNPKTNIPPIIISPAGDNDYWIANNLVIRPQINDLSNIDVYNSGYQVNTCCGYIPQNAKFIPKANCYSGENQLNSKYPERIPTTHLQSQSRENFTYPYAKTERRVGPNEPGFVNTTCGYNPEQLTRSGLPTNFAAGNCEQDPAYKQYNKNLFTQIIQPGVYTHSQITEPINANIGISFNQQFEPTTCALNQRNGEVMYTEHDPRLYEEEIIEPNMEVINAIDPANVYDPRHTGYGTSYRAYNDDNIGQTRFYYDDVNAVKMPNYIARSNIDFARFADSYGPIPEGEEFGNKYNGDIRALANDAWLRSNLQQRTELQQSAMRKVNAEAWQKRVAPIRTSGQRMMGGMSCR